MLLEEPLPLGEIPRLTEGSPESTDIGWQAKRYVAVEPNPAAKRGKIAALTALGLKAQRTYYELNREIEERWQARLGKEKIRRIREALDLVAQTETFVRDPVNALPHYPLWDMNRGFGP